MKMAGLLPQMVAEISEGYLSCKGSPREEWGLNPKPVLWPSNSTSGNIFKGTWNMNSKEYMYPYVHCSIVCNSQIWKQPKCLSVDKWNAQKAIVHLTNGILLSHKEEGNLTFCDSMDGPGEYYGKWNKPVRERQVPYNFIYIRKLKKKIN